MAGTSHGRGAAATGPDADSQEREARDAQDVSGLVLAALAWRAHPLGARTDTDFDDIGGVPAF